VKDNELDCPFFFFVVLCKRGGDIIYGDFPKEMEWMPFPLTLFLPEVPIKNIPFKQSSPEKLSHMYESLKKDQGYAALLEQLGGKGTRRHIGTW
jgi:hypothetical protein